jgi:rod shape-determining protein MreD
VSLSFRSKYRSIETTIGPSFWPTVGWVALAVFAQATLAPLITFRGAVPSFVMIAVVLYAVRVDMRRAAIIGLIAGALEDALGAGSGSWMIATTLVAAGVGAIARGFFSDGFVILGALVGLAVAVRDFLFWGLMRLEGFPNGLGTTHLHIALWQAVLTGTATIVYLIARSRFVVDRTNVERYS